MKVSVEEIQAMRNRRMDINNTPLEDIEWTLLGETVPIPKEKIKEWKFTGLSNIDFIIENFIHQHIVQLLMSRRQGE